MKIQLVGPMTSIEAFNYPAFNEMAVALREQGHTVFNPAETAGPDDYPREYFMRASIAALLHADMVVLLPGWESSPGARTEIRVALALNIPVVASSRALDFHLWGEEL